MSAEPGQHLTVGEALVRLLADYGVDVVFGIPGTHSIELYRGLATSPIQHVLPHHEQGGGFMADGYARVSGKPGVCFVITGPGVTNIATALGEAYMDSVPMLVISPVNEPDPRQINRGRLHEITNQAAVTAPLTTYTTVVTDPDEVPLIIARAFAMFASETPRPVHINIPLSILPMRVSEPWTATPLPSRPVASEAQIDAAAALLQGAARPVMVVGGGCAFDAGLMQQLAEKIPCPVLTTVAARGVIPGSHPLSVGAQLRAPYVQEVLEQADIALLLGTEFAQTDHWNDGLQLPASQIRVNLNAHALEGPGVSLAVLADAGDFANRLASSLPAPANEAVEQAHRRCADARAAHDRDLTARERQHWRVLEVIRDHLPADATVVSDMTQLAYTAVDYLPMEQPRSWLHPTGYGTLGYALPAAMGAVLAKPAAPALVIVGDAGLQYTMQEMTLAAELSLNLVVLLWNNDALQQIRDDMNHAGIAPVGVVQRNPDFLALAGACGWEARNVSTLAELGAGLNDAFGSPGPVLLQLNEHELL